MVTERQMQFRVGMLTSLALAVGLGLMAYFGDIQRYWQKRYPLQIEFESASGLYPGAPVLLSGVGIGNLKRVQLDPDRGGVLAIVEIREEVRLRADSRPVITRSLLGETGIEFTPGRATTHLKPNARVEGMTAGDPLAVVQRLETRTLETLGAFGETSQEWKRVAVNLNHLMETKQGRLDEIVEHAAESLQNFSLAMQSTHKMVNEANKVVADPATQRALRETLVAMPQLIQEARTTITATRQAVESVNRNLNNLAAVTDPIGERGELMVARLDHSLASLDTLLSEMSRFAKAINTKDGTLNRLASDPSVYENIERSSQSLAVLLKNFEGVVRDAKEFSDKIARHPEILGVGGAMKGSSGFRDSELLQGQGTNRSVFRGQGKSPEPTPRSPRD